MIQYTTFFLRTPHTSTCTVIASEIMVASTEIPIYDAAEYQTPSTWGRWQAMGVVRQQSECHSYLAQRKDHWYRVFVRLYAHIRNRFQVAILDQTPVNRRSNNITCIIDKT
jgi:hypothetical protein